jgi:hypothetical protein
MSAPKTYITGHTRLIGTAALKRIGANEKYRVLTATQRAGTRVGFRAGVIDTHVCHQNNVKTGEAAS